MNIKGCHNSDLIKEKLDSESNGKLKEAVLRKMRELAEAIIQVDGLPQLPQSMCLPTSVAGSFRAKVDKDVRLYWHIEDREILVFEDYANHKEAAKRYHDAHNVG